MNDKANLDVYFQKLEHGEDLPLPGYETPESAGMDIRAANRDPIHLKPGRRVLIPTGFRMALPAGYEAQIRPRSGLAYKHGITMLNSPGTIDSDYRGEVKVLAVNHGEMPFTIRYGDRIAQMVIAPVLRVNPRITDDLTETERGDGGFGSTGIG